MSPPACSGRPGWCGDRALGEGIAACAMDGQARRARGSVGSGPGEPRTTAAGGAGHGGGHGWQLRGVRDGRLVRPPRERRRRIAGRGADRLAGAAASAASGARRDGSRHHGRLPDGGYRPGECCRAVRRRRRAGRDRSPARLGPPPRPGCSGGGRSGARGRWDRPARGPVLAAGAAAQHPRTTPWQMWTWRWGLASTWPSWGTMARASRPLHGCWPASSPPAAGCGAPGIPAWASRGASRWSCRGPRPRC